MNSKVAARHARSTAAIMLAISVCGCQSLNGSWYAQLGPSEHHHEHCFEGKPDQGCLFLGFVNTTRKDIKLGAIDVYSSPKPRLKSWPVQHPTWHEPETPGKELKPGELQILILSLKGEAQKCAIPTWALVKRQDSKPIKIKISAALPNSIPDLWALHCAAPKFAPSLPPETSQ